jgi:hypothetical protein
MILKMQKGSRRLVALLAEEKGCNTVFRLLPSFGKK